MISEFDVYITPDGHEYNLQSPDIRFVRSREGTGMPPVEYLTERGPFQHGETLKGFRLRPRTIQMLIRQNYNSRDQYFRGRLQLLDVLRPNRQIVGQLNTGILRKNFADGSKIDIDVMIQQGPNFEAEKSDQWDEYSFDEVIRFVAYNPVFYNPYLRTHDFINTTNPAGGSPPVDPTILGSLVFPAIFPVHFTRDLGTFGGVGEDTPPTTDTNVLIYNGTWIEYPSIVITGPLNSPFIVENITTHERIRFNYTVNASEVVTMTFSYGSKSIVSSLDPTLSLMGYLDPLSDIGSFHLEPGENDFNLTIVGYSSASSVRLLYKERFVGY